MVPNIFSHKGAIAALAVGAGALLGAASVLIYNQITNQKAQNEMHEEIIELGHSVEKIQKELESVRQNIVAVSERRRRRHVSSNASVASDMYSANEDTDEFYDFSSDQDDVSTDTGEKPQSK